MEATHTDLTGYMLGKLDKISEQIHGLEKLLLQPAAAGRSETTKTKRRLFSRIASLPPFWQNIAAGGIIWTFGLSVKAFLDHGGKPLELIELLLKLVL